MTSLLRSLNSYILVPIAGYTSTYWFKAVCIKALLTGFTSWRAPVPHPVGEAAESGGTTETVTTVTGELHNRVYKGVPGVTGRTPDT